VATLEREKAQWSNFLEKGDRREFASPAALSKKLHTVRSENALLLDEQGTLGALLQAKDLALEKGRKLAEDLRVEKEAVEEAREREARTVRRLENTTSRYAQQAELYRQQLDSFDREQTVLMGELIDQSKITRISQLEEQLGDYRKAESDLIAELRTKEEELASLQAKVRDLSATALASSATASAFASQPAAMEVDPPRSADPTLRTGME